MEDFSGGGLGGGETAPKTYFYLVFDSSRGQLSIADKQAYFKLGVSTGPEWIFILVDAHTDKRICGALEGSEAGRVIYRQILANMPCFMICDGRMKRNKRLKETRIIPITAFSEDINLIYDRMGLAPRTTRLRVIEGLREANRIVKLAPNFYGLGADFNAMIARLLDRIESNTP